MSSTMKWVVGVIVVILVAGALWYYKGQNLPNTNQSAAVGNTATSTADTSNNGITTDMVSLDAMVKASVGASAGFSNSTSVASLISTAGGIQDSVSQLMKLAAKFQARISSAQSAKQNVASLQAALADLNLQISNASSLSQSASNNLKKSSTAATVAQAQVDLKAAVADVQKAQADAHTIAQGLAALKY